MPEMHAVHYLSVSLTANTGSCAKYFVCFKIEVEAGPVVAPFPGACKTGWTSRSS